MAIAAMTGYLPTTLPEIRAAAPAISNKGSNTDPEFQKKLAADIESLMFDMKVGDAQAIQDRIEKAGLANEHVPKEYLSEKMKNSGLVGTNSEITWVQLKIACLAIGWAELDTGLSKMFNDGDFSQYAKFQKLLGDDGTGPTPTGNINVLSTAAERLPLLKKWLAANENWGYGDKITLFNAINDPIFYHSWDKHPTDERALMKDMNLVAEGRQDGIPLLGTAIDKGWAGIKNSDKIAHKYITKNSALDKLLKNDPKDPQSRYNIDYGQLLDRVSQEGRISKNNAANDLTQHLSELKALVIPSMGMGSPGNDARTLRQNMEALARNLDLNNPDSRLNKIFDTYHKVYNDIAKVNELNIGDSASDKQWVENRLKDIVQIQDQTGAFFDKLTDYFNKAAKNTDYLKDHNERNFMIAAIKTTVFGYAALSSIGFGITFGRAVFHEAGGKLMQGIKSIPMGGFLGSFALTTSLSRYTAFAALDTQKLNNMMSVFGMDQERLKGVNNALKDTKQAYHDKLINLVRAQANFMYSMRPAELTISNGKHQGKMDAFVDDADKLDISSIVPIPRPENGGHWRVMFKKNGYWQYVDLDPKGYEINPSETLNDGDRVDIVNYLNDIWGAIHPDNRVIPELEQFVQHSLRATDCYNAIEEIRNLVKVWLEAKPAAWDEQPSGTVDRFGHNDENPGSFGEFVEDIDRLDVGSIRIKNRGRNITRNEPLKPYIYFKKNGWHVLDPGNHNNFNDHDFDEFYNYLTDMYKIVHYGGDELTSKRRAALIDDLLNRTDLFNSIDKLKAYFGIDKL